MLSTTLQEGLNRYSIGEKIRALRLRKKLGLVELGRHTGLSPALLSKIERGKLFPTLPTLLRIALVFGVGLEHFFTEDLRRRMVAVVRAKERKRFPEKPKGKDSAFHFECLDFNALDRKLNAYYAEFRPLAAEKVQPHQHAGAEFLFVLRGKLAVGLLDQEYVLDAQDSIYFDSSLPHTYRRLGASPCAALVVTVP